MEGEIPSELAYLSETLRDLDLREWVINRIDLLVLHQLNFTQILTFNIVVDVGFHNLFK